MAYFHPQFPALYAAYPVPVPNDDYYPMYGPNGQPLTDGSGAFYEGSAPPRGKHGFANRKDSADSGISDFSVVSGSSRKTSSTSTISNSGIIVEEDEAGLKEDKNNNLVNADKEEDNTPFTEPDDEMCEKIAQQVEFYFSDANITKDKFLLKHVKRNKEGFVSLKLISSFKRVKHLTKDWRQVAFAIEKKSDKLEVNDLKTKVRRLEALPEYDETTPSRTVVALNLPIERPTIEAVAEIFSVCGDIVLIRILRPGNPVPADIKPFANKHPEMTDKVCALVEFEKTEFAMKAVKELSGKKGEEGKEPMVIMELTAAPVKTGKKEDKKLIRAPMATGPQRRFSHAGFNLPPQHKSDQLALAPGPRRRISLYHNMKFPSLTEEEKKQSENFALNPNAPTFQMQNAQQGSGMMQRRRNYPQNAAQSASYYAQQAAAAHAQAAAMEAAAYNMQLLQNQQSQWLAPQHRRSDGMMAASGLTLPPNVIRLPRGPDKGKGFQKWCRSRMSEQSKTKKSHAVPIVAPPEEKAEPTPKADSGNEEEAAVPKQDKDNERTR